MKRLLFLLFLSAISAASASAQQALLSATVMDRTTRTTLVGANISLVNTKDTTEKHYTSTNKEGRFSFPNIREGQYALRVSFLGYLEMQRNILLAGKGIDLGIIYLTQRPILLDEYVVTGNVPPVVQVGDTIQFNSRAFKLNVDATAEELVSKLPGVTIENNTVKSAGEDVTQVLVDGKRFFGDDPMIALRNLPAEVIDKIQVYDKLSDQAELTGFNDGQTSRTINIITRQDRRRGQFGRIVGAIGDERKYQAVGNVNMFQGAQRITALGQSNNVNQQNFSMQDFLGAMGSGAGGMIGGMRAGGSPPQRAGGGGGGGGGRAPAAAQPAQMAQQMSNFTIGQQNGINTTHALGGQLTDTWGGNLNVEGNYFFNLTENLRDDLTNRQYVLSADTSQYYRQSSLSEGDNYNHRLNLRFDYAIDSTNQLIFAPRLSLQSNATTRSLIGVNWLMQNSLLSQSGTLNRTDVDGFTSSNALTYRRKFDIPGRTLSIGVNANLNDRKNERYLQSRNQYFSGTAKQADSLDQLASTKTNGYSVSANIAYTEPIAGSDLMQVSYTISQSDNATNKRSYNYNQLTRGYDLAVPALSNEVESGYLTHRGNLGYQYRGDGYDMNFAAGYQNASLSADRTYPKNTSTGKSFINVLPAVTLRIGVNRRNSIQLLYRTSTNPPPINQLENTIDNSNPLLLSAGNPDLKQNYSHSLTARYTITNTESMESLFFMLSGGITNDYIGNARLIAQKDTMLEGGILLNVGSQLSRPENLGSQNTVRAMATYSFPISFIQCNLNLNSGFTFTGTPSLVNGISNIGNSTTFSEGISINSNISRDLEFSISYSANFSASKNSIQASLDNAYFSHTANVRFNWTLWEGLTFRTEARNQLYNRSDAGFNQNYTLWNVSLGKKLFKDNAGEISLQGFDLLNQNTNVTQTVTDSYIEEQQTKNLNRYFLLTFSYRLNNF